jgi:hypothetical protein
MKRDNTWRVDISRGRYNRLMKRFDTIEAARVARDAFLEHVALKTRAEAAWEKYRTANPNKRPTIESQALAMIASGIPEPIVRATQP